MDNFLMQTPPEYYLGEWPQYNRDQRVRDCVMQLPGEVLQGGYVGQMICVPGSNYKTVAARGNIRTVLQVPPGSYLVSIKAYTPTDGSMFVLTLYETTSGRYMSNKPVLSTLLGGSPFGISASNAFTARVSPSFLKSPWIVLNDGQVAVELTNLSTAAEVCQVLFTFAVPRGAIGHLADVADLTQKVLGDNPVVQQQQADSTGLASPPWVTPPDGFKSFDYAQAISTPAVLAGDTNILSFTVPTGMDGVIQRIANGYAGPGFVDGSGNIIWRIMIDGFAVQGYDAIQVKLGDINAPTVIAGIQIRSGQVVSLVVNNATGDLPAAGTQCVGRLGGYFYANE